MNVILCKPKPNECKHVDKWRWIIRSSLPRTCTMFHCVSIFYTTLSSFQWLQLHPMELPQLHRTTNQIHSEWKRELVLWVLIKILPDQYLISHLRFPELFLMTVTMTSTIACSRKYESNAISVSAPRVKWNYHYFERMTSLTMTYGYLPCGSCPSSSKTLYIIMVGAQHEMLEYSVYGWIQAG